MSATTGRKWSKFLADNPLAVYLGTKDYLVGYRSPAVDIIEDTGENIGLPINYLNLYARVAVTAADLKTCGSDAVVLIANPGAGYYLSPHKVCMSRAEGGDAYDFAEYLSFKCVGGDSLFTVDYNIFNPTGELNLMPPLQGAKILSNTAFILTLEGGAGGDASVGSGDLIVDIYYNVNQVQS